MSKKEKSIIIRHKGTQVHQSEKMKNALLQRNGAIIEEELEYLIETTEDSVMISACAKINYKTKAGKKRLCKMLDQQTNILIPLIKEYEKEMRTNGRKNIYTLPTDIEEEIEYISTKKL